MKKTHKLLIALLGVIVLAVVGFKAMQPKEPEYQGRKLSEWISDLNEQPPKSTEAEVVVRQMQDVVLPFVEVRILQNEAPESMPQDKRILLSIKDKIMGKRYSRAYQWSADFEALRIVGTNAIPVLERLMINRQSCGNAVNLLAGMDAIQALERGTDTNQIPYTRWRSVQALGGFSQRKKEAAAVLLRLTYDAEQGIVAEAVASLGCLGESSEMVVPRLCEMVKTADERIMSEIVFSLEKFGTNATQAVPLLLKLKTSGDADLRKLVQRALDSIESKPSSSP